MPFFISIVLLFFINHTSFAKTCVINLFQKDSLLDQKIIRVFKRSPDTLIHYPKSISEIQNCFANNEFQQILFLAHGIETPMNNQQYGAPIFFRGKDPVILPQRFFQKMTEIIQQRNTNLEIVRFGFCGSQDSSIKSLVEFLSQSGTQVEFAPESTVYQRIFGIHASRLTLQWLSQSVNKKKLLRWQTEQKSNCTDDSEDGCNRSIAQWVIPYSSKR